MKIKRTRLEGEERERILLSLAALQESNKSTDQSTQTDELFVSGQRYEITYGVEEFPIVELCENETNI